MNTSSEFGCHIKNISARINRIEYKYKGTKWELEQLLREKKEFLNSNSTCC